jgi:TolA-binding protein
MKSVLIIFSIILIALSACSRDKDDFADRVSKADAEIGLGNYLPALNIYTEILKGLSDDPRRAGVLLRIAELQATGLKNSTEARRVYGEVIAAEPLSEAARLAREKRAMLREREGDYEGAIEDYSALLKHFSVKERNQLYRVQVAGVYLSMRDYRQARVELKPLFTDFDVPKEVLEKSIFIAAESYFLEGKSRKASGYYRWLLEEFPESDLAAEAKLHLATCYEEMGYLGVAGSITKSAENDYPNKGVIEARIDSLRARGKPTEDAAEKSGVLQSKILKGKGNKEEKGATAGENSLQSKGAPLASPRP